MVNYTGTNLEPLSAFMASVNTYPAWFGLETVNNLHNGNQSIWIHPNNTWMEADGAWINVTPGDHLYFECWVKTSTLTNLDKYRGGRLGIDYYVNSPEYSYGVARYSNGDAPGRPTGSENGQNPPVDFRVQWGNDWTKLIWDVYVPTELYSYQEHDGSNVSINPIQISSCVPWFDVRESTDDAYAWFSEPKFLKNPAIADVGLPETTDTIGDTSSAGVSAGVLLGYPVTATGSGILASIGLNIENPLSGNLRVAIYSSINGSGQFEGLLGQSADTPAVSGWNDLAIPGGVAITQGTTYYICFQTNASYYYGSSGTQYYIYQSYASFADPSNVLTANAYTANMRITYTSSTLSATVTDQLHLSESLVRDGKQALSQTITDHMYIASSRGANIQFGPFVPFPSDHLWLILYRISGSTWGTVNASFYSMVDELSGRQEADFYMENTYSNRAFCGTYQDIRIQFEGSLIFDGKLMARGYKSGEIRAICYKPEYETMQKVPLLENLGFVMVNAQTILDGIAESSGCVRGLCPATMVSDIKFDIGISALDMHKQLASYLGMDAWSQAGTLNIGTKGVLLGGTLTQSGLFDERIVDDAKKCSTVYIINGGLFGTYGTGQNGIKVFFDSSTTNQIQLNQLAQKKYNEVNGEGGLTFSAPIMQSYNINSGDRIIIGVPELALNGTYIINKITKYATKTTIEVNAV